MRMPDCVPRVEICKDLSVPTPPRQLRCTRRPTVLTICSAAGAELSQEHLLRRDHLRSLRPDLLQRTLAVAAPNVHCSYGIRKHYNFKAGGERLKSRCAHTIVGCQAADDQAGAAEIA
jgi:hypothetical protein